MREAGLRLRLMSGAPGHSKSVVDGGVWGSVDIGGRSEYGRALAGMQYDLDAASLGAAVGQSPLSFRTRIQSWQVLRRVHYWFGAV